MLKRIRVQIEGTVQGVGFRPFVYQLAKHYHLTGWVLNNGQGVVLEVQGACVEVFLKALVEQKPIAAHINTIQSQRIELIEDSDFIVKESQKKTGCKIDIPPDRKVCDRCLEEFYKPNNRRYRDPFINCSQCGPRFTLIKALPYDRHQTAMTDFIWCEKCEEEYTNPANSRFHTESICCPKCEPTLYMWSGIKDQEVMGKEVVSSLRYQIQKGHIVAIKGVGGYHLACLIRDDLIEEVRKRKERDLRPLAIMVKNLEIARTYGNLTAKEAKLLISYRAPIVLVKKNRGFALGDRIAPNTNRIGIMLPYTPFHYLLFEEGIDALIMTSGNKSKEAIYYEDQKIQFNLKQMADDILFHKRNIEIGIDDSVVCIMGGKQQILRRARGYVPEPIELTYLKQYIELEAINGLACGSDLKNTFCILRDDRAYLSQYIGDLESLSHFNFYKDVLEHFMKILEPKVEWIAHDLHPQYKATKYAKKFKHQKLIGIQHHKAHLASCMAENGLWGPVIGVVYDGTGYGEDGHIWGGEFFVGNLAAFKRKGHFQYVKMLGGEKAIKEPWRMAYSYLLHLENTLGISLKEKRHKLYKQFARQSLEEGEALLEMSWKKSLLTPYTSSVGRVFDVVAALLGKGEAISYEAEAALWLESQVQALEYKHYPYEIKNQEKEEWVIELNQMVKALIEDQDKKEVCHVIAAKFHQTLIEITIEMCERLCQTYKINQVALSGGVFQNQLILEGCIKGLHKRGFKVYWQQQVPTNDGGISLGQCVLGWTRFKKGAF